jgi:hypothetical protein
MLKKCRYGPEGAAECWDTVYSFDRCCHGGSFNRSRGCRGEGLASCLLGELTYTHSEFLLGAVAALRGQPTALRTEYVFPEMSISLHPKK